MTRTAGQPGRARVEGVAGLYEQVRLARLWLPLAIVGVVLVHQLLIVPLLPPDGQFWAQLLFYSILGPIDTYVTLNWIAGEARLKERAQAELAELYRELQASHELLSAIQGVTERFAASPSLESTVRAAAEGVAGITGAPSVAVVLGPEGLGITHGLGLDAWLEQDAIRRDEEAGGRARDGGGGGGGAPARGGRTALAAPVVWGGGPEGAVTAYLRRAPGERALESCSIVATQFSAAAEA